VIGVDVGGTNVKYLATDASDRQIICDDIRTDPDDMDGTLGRLAQCVGRQLPAGCARPMAVGLACAGIVDSHSGWLGRSPNLPGWAQSDLGASLSAAFPSVPTVLVNDVNAALYGEYRRGAGRGKSNLVMVALGTGVGGGVIVDGRLLTGTTCGAGEIGHMVLDLDGPRCTCGNRGCLEAFAGSTALLARARRLAAGDPVANGEPAVEVGVAYRAAVLAAGAGLSTTDLYDLAVAGDPTATALFRRAGRRLGQAVAALVNILDPDRVIVGGGVAQAGDLILEPCREMVRTMVLSARGSAAEIVRADLGPFAAALGAAALAREKGAGSCA